MASAIVHNLQRELSWHQRPRQARKCGAEESNQYSNNRRYDDLFIKGNCPCQRHWALIFPNDCCGFQRARGPRRVDVLTTRASMFGFFLCYQFDGRNTEEMLPALASTISCTWRPGAVDEVMRRRKPCSRCSFCLSGTFGEGLAKFNSLVDAFLCRSAARHVWAQRKI